MKHIAKILCLGAAIVAAPLAQADTLNVVAQGTFGTAVSGGTVNNTVTPAPTSGDPNPFTAVYGEQIFVGGSSPLVYCSSCLNFVFQFKNIGAQNDPILNFSMTSFGTFLTTEGYSQIDSEVAPTSVTRTGAAASTITFGFGPNGVSNVAGNGSLTDQLIVFTNATAFAAGNVTFADGATVTGPALLPTASAATPEPSSLVLLGSGLVSAAGMLVRRRRIA